VVSSIGTIAGCYVTRGIVRRNAKVRVIRNEQVLHDGEIDSLKRFTEDVREVRQNFECGVKVEGYNTLQVGDRLQFYVMQRVEQAA
jgi:translation initiation factor IF-2